MRATARAPRRWSTWKPAASAPIVVYQLAFLEAALQRFLELLEMAFDPAAQLRRKAEFVAQLARQNRARESVSDLLRQNCHLLTRKMVERSGELGAHYITRTPREYAAMLRRAAGGGAIMAVTAWLKTILLTWGLPGLLEGFAASVNYSAGFVAIQLTGSTLATKQPANTAPALAERLSQARDPAAMEELVDEVVYLVRSQIASIFGNLALTVPVMWLICYMIYGWTGKPIFTPEHATKVIESISIFGPSPFFAAFTGSVVMGVGVGGGVGGELVCLPSYRRSAGQ